jgi:hypothetical protein
VVGDSLQEKYRVLVPKGKRRKRRKKMDILMHKFKK